jgi:hypothetical protein
VRGEVIRIGIGAASQRASLPTYWQARAEPKFTSAALSDHICTVHRSVETRGTLPQECKRQIKKRGYYDLKKQNSDKRSLRYSWIGVAGSAKTT